MGGTRSAREVCARKLLQCVEQAQLSAEHAALDQHDGEVTLTIESFTGNPAEPHHPTARKLTRTSGWTRRERESFAWNMKGRCQRQIATHLESGGWRAARKGVTLSQWRLVTAGSVEKPAARCTTGQALKCFFHISANRTCRKAFVSRGFTVVPLKASPGSGDFYETQRT